MRRRVETVIGQLVIGQLVSRFNAKKVWAVESNRMLSFGFGVAQRRVPRKKEALLAKCRQRLMLQPE